MVVGVGTDECVLLKTLDCREARGLVWAAVFGCWSSEGNMGVLGGTWTVEKSGTVDSDKLAGLANMPSLKSGRDKAAGAMPEPRGAKSESAGESKGVEDESEPRSFMTEDESLNKGEASKSDSGVSNSPFKPSGDSSLLSCAIAVECTSCIEAGEAVGADTVSVSGAFEVSWTMKVAKLEFQANVLTSKGMLLSSDFVVIASGVE